jgi:hypothetical protein
MPITDEKNIFIGGPGLEDGDIEGGGYCSLSGWWFPASRLMTLSDGRVVGDLFYMDIPEPD